MADEIPVQDSDTSQREQTETPFLDFLLLLANHKKFVIGIPAAVGLIAVIVVLLLPTWYTATARIMPPQQSQSNAVAILGQLGGLSGGVASQALGIKNPSDVYIAMLKSRTVGDRLIERLDLRKIYDKDLYYARRELAGRSFISSGRDGIITIEVDDQDPKRAASIANGYIEELQKLTVNLAVSEAGQRRLFFESQLKKAKSDLAASEGDLRSFSEKGGLINPQGQIGLSVAAAAALRGQISAKEIQLSAMRSFATEQNPEMQRVGKELSGLRSELAKMENDVTPGKGNVMVPFGKAPEVGLEYIRRYRDMKYHETLFEVLAKQYEIARIDEAKDATLIQVLDPALPPEYKSKPHRMLIVLMSLFAALVASVFLVWILDVIHRMSNGDAQRAAKIAKLRRLIFPFVKS
jgi:tyrosine-protein kinase Etk/Wzc